MLSPLRAFALVLAAAGFFATSASGQAWVGFPGSLSTSFDYTWNFSDKFIEEFAHRADEPDGETTRSHVFVLGGEYVPIRNLGISARIPIVAPRYTGRQLVFPAHGRYDDGSRHYVLQDFGLTTRYQVLADPIAITPHIGVSIPMTDYETMGWAAAGRGLKRVELGASVGKFFTSGVPGLYLHGRYGFRLSERYRTEWEETADFNQNSTLVNFMAGYFLLDDLNIHVAADLELSHGGFEVSQWNDYTRGEQLYHDPLLAEDYLLLGMGASYNIRHDLRVNAMFRIWSWGNNTRNASLLGVGVGWDIL